MADIIWKGKVDTSDVRIVDEYRGSGEHKITYERFDGYDAMRGERWTFLYRAHDDAKAIDRQLVKEYLDELVTRPKSK